MRKQNKIVSLVLVVALLLGVFVVIPNTPAVASAAGEEFTPNATFELLTQSGDSIGDAGREKVRDAAIATGVNGNMLTGAYLAKSTPFDHFVVTEGTDSYTMFTPVQSGVYGTDAQILFSQGTKKTTVATDWYVADFDVATEGNYPDGFYVCLPLRDATGNGTATFSPSFYIKDLAPADGAWHHVTLVGNLAANELNIFVDGVLKVTGKTASNCEDLAGKGHTELTHTGLKFSNSPSLEGTYGDTVYIDNASNRIVNGDSATALAAAVKSGQISTWTGYQTGKGGKLPAMAKVDGKEVYTATAFNNLLNNFIPVNVEMLRETRTQVTVNCDATFEYHNLANNVVAGANVTKTATGFDAPHKSSVSEANRPTNTDDVKNATVADGNTSYIQLSGNYADNTADHWLVTDVATGNKYLDIRPGVSFDAGTTHNHWNWITANTTYESGTYFITEFDTYTEAAVMTDLYIGITSRNSKGENKGGTSTYIKDWNLPVGEWAHVTLVGDVDTNVLYVYVNGTLKYTRTNGVANTTDPVAGNFYGQGIRVNVNTRTNMAANQNFAIDNVKYSYNVKSTWYDNNAGVSSIVGSDLYDSNYVLPAIPVLAVADGEILYNSTELTRATAGNTAVNVEILRPYLGTVTVEGDAIIETNGYTVPSALADVTRTNDGTVYTYDAPFRESLSATASNDRNAWLSAMKGNDANNILASIGGTIHEGTKGIEAAVVTNRYAYNDYLTFELVDDSKNANAYMEFDSLTTFTYDATKTQFYIFEVDIAILNNGGPITNQNIARENGSIGPLNGGLPTLTSIAGDDYGTFHHYTYVFNMNTNVSHIYRDGVRVATGIVAAQNNMNNYLAGTSTMRIDGIRYAFEADNASSVAFDNATIKTVSEPVSSYASNSLTAAFNASNIGIWGDSITTASAEIAPIAIVDGEYVGSAVALNSILSGISQKNVEILRSEATEIIVNRDAVINTNGLNVTLVPGTDVKVTSNGNVYTYDAAWKASATEKEVNNISAAISSLPGNLLAGKGSATYITNNDNSFKLYEVTDVETGKTYIKLQPTLDGNTTKNIYVNAEVLGAPAAGNTTADCVLKDGEGYVVYDMKLATDSTVLQNLTFDPVMRNNASEASTFPFGTHVTFADYVTAADEWIHLTLVADLASNTQYVFINGELAGTNGKANEKPGEYEYLNVKGFRLNLAEDAQVSENETLLIDDVTLRVYKSSDELAAAINGNTLANWCENLYEGNDKLPLLATVDGKNVYTVDALTNALKNGANHRVTIERNVVGTAYAASTTTIVTNGLANFVKFVEGFKIVDNGNGTYSIVVATNTGKVVITLNGEELINNDVLYGTDILEYLNRYHSYIPGNSSGRGAFAADNGQLYYKLTWSNAPEGVVEGDVTFALKSAEIFTGAFLALEANGDARNEDSIASFLGWSATRSFVVILNRDYTLEDKPTFEVNGVTRSIYLNGHTLTFPSNRGSSHAMEAKNNCNVKIIGGNVVDNVRSDTTNIIFTHYEYNGTVEFVDCNVYACSNVATVRGGTVTFDNCEIVNVHTQNSQAFQLCEYYNGYTENKVTLNLINTTLRYTNVAEKATAFIQTADFSEWGTGKDKYDEAIANGADKLAHEINISGCTFLGAFNAPLFDIRNVNTVLNITDTQFNVKTMFKNTKGNITIGKNVYSAIQLPEELIAEGLFEVKSGNPVAPYLYAEQYATVIWADGTTEKWAINTYPVNPKYNKAEVPLTESGVVYNIADNSNVAISMKANLSLSANLKLNVYIPTTVNLTAFNVSGIYYSVADAVIVEIDGAEFYYFGYEMAPHLATGNLAIAATVGGVTVAKSLNLTEYVDKVIAQYPDNTDAQNLVKSVLTYIATAGKYMGAYTQGYDATNNYADAPAITMNGTAINTMSNVNAYLTGASLDLNAAPAWAFTLAAGADISDLVIKVDGKNVKYTVEGGRVIVELRAYDMLDTITVTVGGKTGEYNFAAYYTAMKTLSDGTTLDSNGKAGANVAGAQAKYAMSLLDAFYTYASYAQTCEQ